jgi:hypothetical protein
MCLGLRLKIYETLSQTLLSVLWIRIQTFLVKYGSGQMILHLDPDIYISRLQIRSEVVRIRNISNKTNGTNQQIC